ncbi:unnamed protein product, partial [Menidia menidia]
EISRLAAQLRRLYGSNRKSRRPFHLFLTELRAGGRLHRECVRMNDGFLNYTMEITEESCLDLFPPETVVYLTPDAEEVLDILLTFSETGSWIRALEAGVPPGKGYVVSAGGRELLTDAQMDGRS